MAKWNGKAFAYINCTGFLNNEYDRVAYNKFDTDTLWSDSFVQGTTTFGLFSSESGKTLYAVATSGSWGYWELEKGQAVGFQHTQNFRTKTLIYSGELTYDRWLEIMKEAETDPKVAKATRKKFRMWTLK